MKRTIVIFCFLACYATAMAQSQTGLVLYQLGEVNGLSDNLVTCFYQDSRGIMWIGTQDGLNRYDGSAFKIFNTTNSKLPGNNIRCIKEDARHHLWITAGKGLCEYDPQADRFLDHGNATEGASDFAIDHSGKIWLGTGNGLIVFDPATGIGKKYFSVDTGGAKKRANSISKLIIDRHDRVWIGTVNGLYRFVAAKNSFEAVPGGSGFILSMYEDPGGMLWLGYWNEGLKRYDAAESLVTPIKDPAGPSIVSSISGVKNAKGIFSTWCNGLWEYDAAAGHFTRHSDVSGSGDVYNASALFTSSDGGLWMNGEKGIHIMYPGKQFFHHHFLSEKEVSAQGIALLPKGNQFYLGASGPHFLSLYDSLFHCNKILAKPSNSDGTPATPAVLNLVREDDTHIWLCTEQGLLLYDEVTHAVKSYRVPPAALPVGTLNFITSMFIDGKGNHWVFPWRSGIWKLDVKSGRFSMVTEGITRDGNGLKRLVVSAAAEDAHGNIWMADLDEGLVVYNTSTKQFSKPTASRYGPGYNIQNVESEGERIWTVKTGAVFCIDVNTNSITEFAIPQQFNKSVTGFCDDGRGHFWIATTGGLLVFDKQRHSFKRFTSGDGLVDNLMHGTLSRLANGHMLYAQRNYITEFDPAKLTAPATTPPVLLTGIYSQNKLLHATTGSGQKMLRLGHDYDNFVFEWAILNYANPTQNNYYCKLEGVDKDWKYTGHTGQVQYASLAPGTYTLRVKAATPDGVMSEKEDTLRLIILPPFWRTWWFITLVSLALLAVVVWVVRYISQRNLKERLLQMEKEQAIEKERNRISRDMHDDLGSGLTKIVIMSEVVKKQLHEPEKARLQLENISNSSRELVDNLQDIIWVLNTRHDSLESLAAYTREYALKYFEPFDIAVHFQYPAHFAAVKLTEEQRRNIFMVVKETFHNVSRHAWCNNVTVGIHYVPGSLRVTIRDDGRGFDMNDVRRFGNGLVNMQHRVEQAGGRFAIQSEPGSGTLVTIQLQI